MREERYILVSLLTLILIALASVSFGQYNINCPALCISAVILLTVTFLVYQQNSIYKGLWYKPSNVFLLSFLIVNFQYVFDLVVGFKKYSSFDYPETVNKMSVLCSYGLLAFMIGYYISSSLLKKKKRFSEKAFETHVRIDPIFISVVQVVLFGLWLLSVDYYALISGRAYGAVGHNRLATFAELLFYCSTLTLLVTVILNSRSLGQQKYKDFLQSISVVNWVVIGLYCIIRMFSGDRGPFLYTVLAVFFAYVASTRVKINLIKLILPAVGFILLMNLIGMARKDSLSMSFGTRISNAYTEFMGTTEGRFSDKTILPGTDELASSNLCNQIAINMVDYKGHPLHMGGYVVAEVVQCIPFVSSFLVNNLKISDKDLSSNMMMTEEYVGRSDIYQIGTTVIAESYFDFKTIGVILMMLIVGWSFYRVDNGICIRNPDSELALMVFMLLASMAVYIPRATFFGQLKNFVPMLVMFYISKILFQKKSRILKKH